MKLYNELGKGWDLNPDLTGLRLNFFLSMTMH